MESNPASTMTQAIRARFSIVTPMFLGGAGHEAETIRPPSVKGALRFWWRALQWGRFRKKSPDDVTALKALHGEEARLFGASAEQGGQGCFLLAVECHGLTFGKPPCEPYSPRSYLLGQGLFGHGQVTRDAILSGEFTLKLRFRPGTSENDREAVLKALRIFGLLGGLGSRARRGWGSVALQEMDGLPFSPPQSLKDYAALLNEIKPPQGAFPPFTAVSSQMQRLPDIKRPTALAVLDEIGGCLGLFRAFGRKQGRGEYRAFGKPVEKQRFKASDHDPMRQIAEGNSTTQTPQRLIFGMPHNYFFTSFNPARKVEIQASVPPPGIKRDARERRASPLFIHIHSIGTEFCGFQLVLPAPILPQDDRLKMVRPKSGGLPEFSCTADYIPQWGLFKDYFDFVKEECKKHGNP